MRQHGKGIARGERDVLGGGGEILAGRGIDLADQVLRHLAVWNGGQIGFKLGFGLTGFALLEMLDGPLDTMLLFQSWFGDVLGCCFLGRGFHYRRRRFWRRRYGHRFGSLATSWVTSSTARKITALPMFRLLRVLGLLIVRTGQSSKGGKSFSCQRCQPTERRCYPFSGSKRCASFNIVFASWYKEL